MTPAGVTSRKTFPLAGCKHNSTHSQTHTAASHVREGEKQDPHFISICYQNRGLSSSSAPFLEKCVDGLNVSYSPCRRTSRQLKLSVSVCVSVCVWGVSGSNPHVDRGCSEETTADRCFLQQRSRCFVFAHTHTH